MNMRLPVRAESDSFAGHQGGNSLVETALVLPVLLLILVAAVDVGRAFRAAMIVTAAARTGAAYGVLNPTDINGMLTAAQSNSSSIVTVTSTATSGCECSNGTLISCSTSSPSCSDNSVYFVQVNSTASYKPLLTWPGIPATIPLSGQVRLRASR